jgi:site-specific DNA recombinase
MPPESTKALRCAMYARYSPKPEGAMGENYSIGSQLDAMREKVARDFGCTAPVEFIDRNVSGGSLDRPGLEALRDAVAARLFDVVIAYSPDRLTRLHIDSLLLLQEFSKARVKLAFVSGSYDESPEGDLSYGVQSLVSEYERKKFAERSRRGRKRKAREGFVNSTAACYGYRYLGFKLKKRGELAIIPEQAVIVERIFKMAAGGSTNYEMAMVLNGEGVKTAKGGKWWRESIAQVLRKTQHYGEFLGRSGIPVKVPAIIDRRLWDQAHVAQERNRVACVGRPSDSADAGKGYAREYLLTGFLWCEQCGARYTTVPGSGGRDSSYRCSRRDPFTNKRICAASGVLKSILEPVIWDAIWDTITDPELLWNMIAAYYDRVAARPDGKKDAATIRIEKAQQRVAHAERVLRDPEQPIPYERAKRDLEAARRELLEAETARPADVFEMPERKDITALARQFAQARTEIKDFADRRGILKRVVNKILYVDRAAEIHCAIQVNPKKNCNGKVDSNYNSLRIPFVLHRRVA